MPGLLRPFQVLYPRRSVPVGRLAIDWSHPLTNGLVACYIPGATRVDLTGINGDLVSDTAATTGLNKDGPAASSIGANSGFYGLTTDPSQTATASMFWCGSFVPLVGTNQALAFGITVRTATPEVAPYLFGVQRIGSSQISFTAGGTFAQNNVTTVDETGIIQSAGLTYDSVSGAMKCYYKGALGGSFSQSGSFPYTSTSRINLGGYDPVPTRDASTITSVYFQYNRVLSASEVSALDANPYAFLVPAYQESLPAIAVVSGAGVDHLAAAAAALATGTAALDLKHHLAAAAVAVASASAGLRVWHHLNAAAVSIASATAALDVQSAGQDHLSAAAQSVATASASLRVQHHLAAAAAAISNATANIDRQAQLAAAASSIASASAALEVVTGNTKHLSASAQVIASATALARSHLHFAADAKAVSTATATLPDRSSANFLVTTQMVVDMIMPAGRAHHQAGKVRRKKKRERELVD